MKNEDTRQRQYKSTLCNDYVSKWSGFILFYFYLFLIYRHSNCLSSFNYLFLEGFNFFSLDGVKNDSRFENYGPITNIQDIT